MKEILLRFKDTIQTTISAHTHKDSLTFIRDDNFNIFHINYVVPSLTTGGNPSYRIF